MIVREEQTKMIDEMRIGYGRLRDEEYKRAVDHDPHMKYKPVIDAKIQKLVSILKIDNDADFISAWVKYPFWEGRLNINLGSE